MRCPRCGRILIYDTNRRLSCPNCDKGYWDMETRGLIK